MSVKTLRNSGTFYLDKQVPESCCREAQGPQEAIPRARKTLGPFYFKDLKKQCGVKGCNRVRSRLHYCVLHKARFEKWGDPLKVGHRNISGSLNPNWHGGVAEYHNHAFFKKQRLIILISNPKCEVCRIKKATIVHHKDETKSNHELSNLIAVCRKCHINKFHKRKKNELVILG